MVRVGLIVAVVTGCTYSAPELPGDGPVTLDTPVDTPVDMPPDMMTTPFWTAVVGADAVGNTLKKTTAFTGWGDAGATSFASVPSGDCFVEFKTAESTTAKAVGLSRGDTNQSFNDIDFDLVLGTNKKVYIYEGAVLRGQVATYDTADTFRVEVVGGVVGYRQNGTLLFTSLLTHAYPLLVDAALYSPDATITDVVFSDQ